MTIHGTNFVNGGVAPIVDFGTVASIGSMTYGGTSITTTIPPGIDPGTVNITVTTPAGTSAVSVADQFTYTGSGSTTAPGITSADHTTFSSGTAERLQHHDDGDARRQLGPRHRLQWLHPVDAAGQRCPRLHRRHHRHPGRDTTAR